MAQLSRNTRRLLKIVKGQTHADQGDTEDYESNHVDPLSTSTGKGKRVDSGEGPDMKSESRSSKRKRISGVDTINSSSDIMEQSTKGSNKREPLWMLDSGRPRKTAKKGPTYGNAHQSQQPNASEKKPILFKRMALADLDTKRKQTTFNMPTPPTSSLERKKTAPSFRTPGTASSESSSQPDQPSQEGNIHTAPLPKLERPSKNDSKFTLPQPLPAYSINSPTKQPGTNSRRSRRSNFHNPNTKEEPESREASPALSTTSSMAEPPDTEDRPALQACPMCGISVPTDDLELFKASCPIMTMRDQQKFCHQHKKAEAEAEWTRRGYPTIDWDGLEVRMKHFEGDIVWLMERPQKSWFRSQLEHRVDTGKGRNLVAHLNSTGLEDISVGYYGTRGLRAISEFITRSCSDTIRQHAGSDKFIAARDVSGYVQMVLAPELAMRLIMEDLSVDAEQAREVMGNSVNLGDLVNGGADLDNELNARERESLAVDLAS